MGVDDVGLQLSQQFAESTDGAESQTRSLVGTQDRDPEPLDLAGEGAWPFQADHRRIVTSRTTKPDQIHNDPLETTGVERHHHVGNTQGRAQAIVSAGD